MESIEILYSKDCPSHSEAYELVQELVAEGNLGIDVKMREVRTQQEAIELGFPGSPTIRVDGRDIDPVGADQPPTLTSRIYHLTDARVTPIPSRDQLEVAFGIRRTLGQPAPAFKLKGVDGNEHSLADYDDAALLVLVWFSNFCPFARVWEDRMIEIQRDYADRGVQLVAINSNDGERVPKDSFEGMVKRATDCQFNFDYLNDGDQSLARAMQARRTPEVFVFDRNRVAVYHGSIDDNHDETAVTRNYLRDALDALLAGKEPPMPETQAVGCTIKWKSS